MRDGLKYLLEELSVAELTRSVRDETHSIQKTVLPYQSPCRVGWWDRKVHRSSNNRANVHRCVNPIISIADQFAHRLTD